MGPWSGWARLWQWWSTMGSAAMAAAKEGEAIRPGRGCETSVPGVRCYWEGCCIASCKTKGEAARCTQNTSLLNPRTHFERSLLLHKNAEKWEMTHGREKKPSGELVLGLPPPPLGGFHVTDSAGRDNPPLTTPRRKWKWAESLKISHGNIRVNKKIKEF